MRPAPDRMPLIDALKGIACVMIVWHHLAFYGPMSDAVHPLAPGLIDWLYAYARMAVQVFLVLGGFLAAMTLAPDRVAAFERPWSLIRRRYQRLVTPYLVALTLALVSALIARQLIVHDSIPGAPGAGQLLAHALLLHDLLDREALSAGVWYVAIDFQLYTLAVAVFALAARLRTGAGDGRAVGVALIAAITIASLFHFNRDTAFDEIALYFAGSHGLGMLAFWGSRSRRPVPWIVGIALIGATALMLDFRPRIAIALATALLLAWGQASGRANRWPVHPWLAALGQMSYSMFLIHFPVCLLVNAVVSRLWPGQAAAGALGMIAAFALSLAAATVLYRRVERQPLAPLPDLRYHAGFLGVGMLAAAAGGIG